MKNEYWLLGIILIFALFLRLYSLDNSPLWIDEAISSGISSNILEKGVPILDSGVLYSRAYVFHYMQAGFLLFGLNDFNARLVSVLFGLLTVVLIYFISKEYSKHAWISALFCSLFYLEVFYSRQARFYQFFQLMFFLSIYLLYKSKDNPKFLIYALISFFITLDTHISGLVLAPFFIVHIWLYSWKMLTIIPLIPLVYKTLDAFGYASKTNVFSYLERYTSYTSNLGYFLVLFIPGLVWSFFKRKRLTILLALPSFLLLFGVFFVKMFALRYSYFFVFPLILYVSLLFSFLYEKYGKIILLTLLLFIVIPSNLVFPLSYVNIILPVSYNFNDVSSPEITYSEIPTSLLASLRSNVLVSYFSPSVEWYIKKPDYVIPFSMTGLDEGFTNVDVYSGSKMFTSLNESFYLIVDNFSFSKLNSTQVDSLMSLDCEVNYTGKDFIVYLCNP